MSRKSMYKKKPEPLVAFHPFWFLQGQKKQITDKMNLTAYSGSYPTTPFFPFKLDLTRAFDHVFL